MEPRPLKLIERAALAFIQFVGVRTEGYTVAFAEELIRQHGLRGFFGWAKNVQQAWAQLVQGFGEADAHLLASFASFWNGCHYCAQGHLLAHNLHLFEQQEQLFPLDEQEILELLRQRDGEILSRLRERLNGRFEDKRALLERQHLLKVSTPGLAQPAGAPPALDEQLRRSLSLYDWVNECSIMSDADPPPLGPIAKKKELIARYQEARSRQRAATVGTPAPAAAG